MAVEGWVRYNGAHRGAEAEGRSGPECYNGAHREAEAEAEAGADTNTKAANTRPKQLFASPELFVKAASPDSAYGTAVRVKTNCRPIEPDETVTKTSERISAKTEARLEFGHGSEYPVSYNETRGQSEDLDRYLSRNELGTEAKADGGPKLKLMVASSELFGEVASLDAVDQAVVKHPKSIMMDGSTEADETVANTGTDGRSRGLFGECTTQKEDRRDRSVLVERIPSPKTENTVRNSSKRIPRTKTLSLESGSENEDEAQDESASVPCRPDMPPPKTHRQIKTLSPKRKSNGDRSREMPASSVKDETRPTTIPKALKERSSEASEADKCRRSLTEVRYRDSRRHENVVGCSQRPQSTCSATAINAALERSRSSLCSRTKSPKANRRIETFEACNEVHARITASEARTPPDEEWILTSLGGIRSNVAINSAEALKNEEDADLPVRENTVSLLSSLVKDMEPNSHMKLRLNEAAQLLAPKHLVIEVIRRSCENTTSGYFGIKRIKDEAKCPYYSENGLANHERTQTYKAYVERVQKRSTEEPRILHAYREVCAETNTCLVSDLWTTPKSSTEAMTEGQIAQNEDQGYNEPMGFEASCGIDEDQSQTRPTSQVKRLEDFVRSRPAMRMFHRRRASF